MSTSVGYTSPINGSNVAFQFLVVRPQNSGGAIRGYMPQQTQNVDKRYPEFEQIRFTLKNAWNTTYPSQLRRDNLKQPITTPFRAVNNAGDLLSRENYSCGGSCQTPQSIPNVKGIRQRIGATSVSCQPSVLWSSTQVDPTIPSSTCNVKYVYDSSDYIRFKKDQAVNRNYNDRSFGGNEFSGSQSAIRHIRRY